MHLVVIGLSLSSSWGNGHATTFRALLEAFAARGKARVQMLAEARDAQGAVVTSFDGRFVALRSA